MQVLNGAWTDEHQFTAGKTDDDRLTVRAGQGTSGADRADGCWVRTVRELEPVLCVGLQVDGLNLQSEIDIVRREGLAGVDCRATQGGVVEDLE